MKIGDWVVTHEGTGMIVDYDIHDDEYSVLLDGRDFLEFFHESEMWLCN